MAESSLIQRMCLLEIHGMQLLCPIVLFIQLPMHLNAEGGIRVAKTSEEFDFLSSLQNSDEPVHIDGIAAHRESVARAKEFLDRSGTIGLFTTNTCAVPGWRVVRTLPMITARRVIGLNFWKDFLINVRDFVGGRSTTAESAIAQIEGALFQELQVKAATLQCHAIVGVQVQFGEISGGGKSQMFYATAQGTPVVMEEVQT